MKKTIGFEDLPFKDFEKIGLDRNSVLQLRQDLIYLMTFRRTRLIPIIDPKNSKKKVNVKLSLKGLDSGKVKLLIHPVQKKLKNSFHLSDRDFKIVEKGGLVLKDSPGVDKNIFYVIQKDKETNEMLRLDLSKINIDLSDKQLDQIKKEGKINLVDETLIIDLTKPEGFVMLPNDDTEE